MNTAIRFTIVAAVPTNILEAIADNLCEEVFACNDDVMPLGDPSINGDNFLSVAEVNFSIESGVTEQLKDDLISLVYNPEILYEGHFDVPDGINIRVAFAEDVDHLSETKEIY